MRDRRHSSCAALLGLAAALCLAPAAQAQWKWVTPSGVTKYSDLPPPPDTPLHDILARPTPTSVARPAVPASAASSAAARAVREQMHKSAQQAAEQRKAQEQARHLQDEVQAQQRAQACAQARQQLQVLDSGRRIRQVDAQGQPAYLDSAQVEAQRAQAQAQVQQYCR